MASEGFFLSPLSILAIYAWLILPRFLREVNLRHPLSRSHFASTAPILLGELVTFR